MKMFILNTAVCKSDTCEQICIIKYENGRESAECECEHGFTLNTDKRSCLAGNGQFRLLY